MNRHPIDSTALIFGLLFGLAGMAILIDETADVDATLVTGAVVGALGIAFVATLVTRQVRVATAGSPQATIDEPMTDAYGNAIADDLEATEPEAEPSTQD